MTTLYILMIILCLPSMIFSIRLAVDNRTFGTGVAGIAVASAAIGYFIVGLCASIA